ncbi:uncharacterized protein LOC127721052 [Mytilus californianus]|uniref:uncharacterized protein LOC127721052 n=1 Tax=Mytilus californianus TaxID=6549 RepID=UPI002245304A|nr:uncharacterized protein LOC127721052 [Mytilus californianus]
MKWTYLCLCMCLFMGEIECGGQIWLKLVSFQNRRSLDAAGFLCDHHWGVKTSDCDHKFIICVDNINGYESTNVCSYGRWSTDIIRNADYITFGKDIRLYSNPKTFSFHKWTGSCKLKIDVYDHDTLEDDYVDSMTGHYIMERPYYNETNAKPKTLKLSNRVR